MPSAFGASPDRTFIQIRVGHGDGVPLARSLLQAALAWLHFHRLGQLPEPTSPVTPSRMKLQRAGRSAVLR